MVIITPRNEVRGGYTGITLSVRPSVCLSVRPSVCRRARLGKIARLGIGCSGGYFVPLGQPHSSFRWGEISQFYHQDVTCGCNFHNLDLHAFIPVSWCNFYNAPGFDRGHIVLSCLSVCLFVFLSVCLLSTVTFAITFEP